MKEIVVNIMNVDSGSTKYTTVLSDNFSTKNRRNVQMKKELHAAVEYILKVGRILSIPIITKRYKLKLQSLDFYFVLS